MAVGIALLIIGAAAAIGIGLAAGAQVGGAVATGVEAATNIAVTTANYALTPIRNKKGEPDPWMALKQILATPVTLAPVLTITLLEASKIIQKALESGEITRFLAMQKLSPEDKVRIIRQLEKQAAYPKLIEA